MNNHRRCVLLIVLFSLLTFGNCLPNGFVGDDDMLIVHNSFYTSWANFPRLFSASYITQPDDVVNRDVHSRTGSVAYRPVLSFTFFVDRWLWGLNPWGHHFSNLVLHVLNAALVYFVVVSVLPVPSSALWAAILFAVHPLKSEAVCAIGYRADVLSAFFFLLAFLSYIRSSGEDGKPWVRGISHIAFFLAVFSKESAVIFLPVVMAFDRVVRKEKTGNILRHLCGRYPGYVLITVFYLFVYTMVFRNSTLDNLRLLGGTVPGHVLASVGISLEYLKSFMLPFTVKILPPLYVPPHTPWVILPGLLAVVWAAYKVCRMETAATFFFLWFLISLVPVSNIIPLVNPMAYRFMYLPSVGLAAVAAILLERAIGGLGKFFRGTLLAAVIRWGWIVLCVVMTFSLNMAWKDNFRMAGMMIWDFPRHPLGYLHLGMAYFRIGDMERARRALREALKNGLEDPRGYYCMALTYLNDSGRARPFYEKSIRLFPYYALSYVGLGRTYVLEGAYEDAIPYLERAVALAPSYTGYGYLIQSYLRLDRGQEAQAIYVKAKASLKEKSDRDLLGRMLREDKNLPKPVDIGI